jgi:hypothetical protein
VLPLLPPVAFHQFHQLAEIVPQVMFTFPHTSIIKHHPPLHQTQPKALATSHHLHHCHHQAQQNI